MSSPNSEISGSSTDKTGDRNSKQGQQRKVSNISQAESGMLQKVKQIIPPLANSLHKGQCGRIGVFGGCAQYTGAPYFAAISALKTGADMVHVFCEAGAGSVIKGYSPELMVHPVMDKEYGMEEIEEVLPRLHCVVLGPGMGRNQAMLGRVSLVVEKCKALSIPLVLDADALWHLASRPQMLTGYSSNSGSGRAVAVLTPNAMEFSRLVAAGLGKEVQPGAQPQVDLVQELARCLGPLTVLHKGDPDTICSGSDVELVGWGGCPRRCGGQGDVLAGSLATFLHWAVSAGKEDDRSASSASVVAAWGASRLVRACAQQAFRTHGRSVTTTDIISCLGQEFSRLYETETYL